MKKAIIIADYGKDTGMGHLVRCSTLAKELMKHFEVTFYCDDNKYSSTVAEIAGRADVKMVAVNDVWNAASNMEASIIIVDSIKNTMPFMACIKNLYDLCVVIDDNNHLPFYDTDIIINQNIGAEKNVYTARKDTLLLLGIKYLMLADKFVNKPPIDINADVHDIVVTMGASDNKNTTEKVLGLLKKHNKYKYNVVVGAGFENTGRLEQYAANFSNVELHYKVNMAELLCKCQAAVSACGLTIYELASLGIPTIGIVTADNQRNASINMEDAGIIFSAGLEEKLSDTYFDMLFEDVVENKEVREKMHKTQLNAVNRQGIKEITDSILSKFTEQGGRL